MRRGERVRIVNEGRQRTGDEEEREESETGERRGEYNKGKRGGQDRRMRKERD